jgi:hypothetical protein
LKEAALLLLGCGGLQANLCFQLPNLMLVLSPLGVPLLLAAAGFVLLGIEGQLALDERFGCPF